MPLPSFRDRPDIAPDVIHFTKGPSADAAFHTFCKIVAERRLLGGDGFIKGGFRCVCFTEAPLDHLAEIFWWSKEEQWRYMPFGVLVSKAWLFERGGRPVIYQAEDEYDLLPESHKYRHVRYEPHRATPIDFTWEREWRLLSDELPLDPRNVHLVIPSDSHADNLRRLHDRQQEEGALSYVPVMGETAARQLIEPFPWQLIVLDDLRPDWHYADVMGW